MHFTRFLLGAAVAGSICLGTAQAASDYKATVNDPIGPVPDPTRVTSTMPKDFKCTGAVGKQETCILFGDPAKPGPYMVMYKWYPGNFSKPHFHNNVRWAYIISGTWWTSSSCVYDERTTYPVHAGMVAADLLNGIHWDGARTGEKEPAVLILSGNGPNITQGVDENCKPSGPAR